MVVDLGYGASPVTALELHDRLRRVRPDVEVVGIEIDPARVAAALPLERPGLRFAVGGFEVPLPGGARPVVVRAFNVLRQYDESQVADAWATTVARLAPDGLLVDGTCDELGRLATWVAVTADGPVSLSLSWRLRGLERPGVVAERLPEGADPPQRARRGGAPAALRPRRGVGAAGTAGGLRHPSAVHRHGGGDAGCRVAGSRRTVTLAAGRAHRRLGCRGAGGAAARRAGHQGP